MGGVPRLLVAGLILAAAGCASAGSHPGQAAEGDENVITEAQLRDAPPSNLADYIQARRPRWLQRNYAPVFRADRVRTIMVFLDEQEYGGPDALRSITTLAAREVRYYSPSEAEARFGPGYINGVIQVLSSGRH